MSFNSRKMKALLVVAVGLAALAILDVIDDPLPEDGIPAAQAFERQHMPAPSFSVDDVFRVMSSRF